MSLYFLNQISKYYKKLCKYLHNFNFSIGFIKYHQVLYHYNDLYVNSFIFYKNSISALLCANSEKYIIYKCKFKSNIKFDINTNFLTNPDLHIYFKDNYLNKEPLNANKKRATTLKDSLYYFINTMISKQIYLFREKSNKKNLLNKRLVLT